ncbi:MAG: 4Fe-4S ferredoxin, partial [Ruminococcaceae bacterium]|nr:4Fe-4S ferredoxin [Oscillospiraceae bacterium]
MQETMKKKASDFLNSGTGNRVIGWREGEFSYDISPDIFNSSNDVQKSFVYNDFCGANVSKYLIKETKKDGKILAFLKPCDTFSFNQLCAEYKITREKVHIIGIGCDGKADVSKIKEKGIDGILGISRDGDNYIIKTIYGDEIVNVRDVMAERCLSCKSKRHVVFDELMCDESDETHGGERFDSVKQIESMTSEERNNFWREHLSRCIRCNACRNVCPAC